MYPKSPSQVLKELKLLQEKLSGDLYAKVGNVFLGGSYKIAKAQGAKIPKGATVAEPNTEWESELDANLTRWVNVSDDDTAKYFKKNKSLLDKLKKEFPQLLQPPTGQPAYRGTIIKLNSLKNAFLKKKFTVVKLGGREMFYFNDLGYSPNRGAQSWTLDPKVAFNFQGRAGKPATDIPVVYSTVVNNDFVFNPLLLQIIWGVNEKETLRVAGKGTFKAYVDKSAIINTWNLSISDNFIHKLPSAKPYFKPIIDKYNELVKQNRQSSGAETVPYAVTIEDINDIDQEYLPFYFNLDGEYKRAGEKYIKSIKK